MRDRLAKLGVESADVDLKPGRSGQFDVTIDGKLEFTRAKTGRFPTDSEIDDFL